MKILTLNTHSIIEKNYEEKLVKFVEMIKEELPDVFALQEVNQSITMPETGDASAVGYIACLDCEVTIRTDNHAYRVAKMLHALGVEYQWTWVPAKVGYGIYDEGIAVFSKSTIEDICQFHISKSQDYNNWKTRKMLGIYTNDMWFYSVHMGWWKDEEEPFAKQWDTVVKQLKERTQTCFVMGDFNSPADKKQEGYEYVIQSGWNDTWLMAKRKDEGITVGGNIDGWNDKANQEEMRIDYIFCNKEILVESSEVIFNGKNYPIVSDHYGVVIEIVTR
ncbi:MAG: endonuclease/exonuclease/phosphatase family protein [Tyzzerella sp.]|nr:endonuclease/exonuclease/phosphatase family protein [Tyzzerella sp.]